MTSFFFPSCAERPDPTFDVDHGELDVRIGGLVEVRRIDLTCPLCVIVGSRGDEDEGCFYPVTAIESRLSKKMLAKELLKGELKEGAKVTAKYNAKAQNIELVPASKKKST